VQQDFAPTEAPQDRRNRRLNIKMQSPAVRTLAVLAVCVITSWLIFGSAHKVAANTPVEHDEWIKSEAMHPAVHETEKRAVLKPGDAAVTVLGRMGFPYAEINAIVAAAKPVFPLNEVRAGHSIIRKKRDDMTDVYYQVDANRLLHLALDDGDWHATLEPRAASTRRVVLQGEIHDNLFSDAAAVGLDDGTTMNLVDIFAWDIDFARDLRQGDRFRVLLEERFDAQGHSLGSTIMAAEFVNQGRTFQAIRFQFPDGRVEYYTPEGKSMRKTYLKAPVKFTRISSRFSLARKHPILGYTRAHHGVDYAAPRGTPVHAVGNGRVIYKGWAGGYGRFIRIQHTNAAHSTAYAHLSRYAHGIRRGVYVHQGEVIGYVGMSGLATGPHLHFEFRIHGRPVNPLTVKRVPAKPVPASEKSEFRMMTARYLKRMQQTPILLAWG